MAHAQLVGQATFALRTLILSDSLALLESSTLSPTASNIPRRSSGKTNVRFALTAITLIRMENALKSVQTARVGKLKMETVCLVLRVMIS